MNRKEKRRSRRIRSIEKEYAKLQFAKKYKGYNPKVGWVDHEYIHGVNVPVGNHLKKMQNSKLQKDIKKRTSRKIRRSNFEMVPKGNGYRKAVDYWWEML